MASWNLYLLILVHFITLLIYVLANDEHTSTTASARNKRIYIDGDIILGALFPVHHKSTNETKKCGEIWEQYGIQRIEAFLLVIERINNDSTLLPNVKLGVDIRDSCWYTPKALEETKDFIRASIFNGHNCAGQNITKPIAGVIGPGSSAVTEDVQNMLSQFDIPQIGYSSTSITLSNTDRYPYFLRVVSPDSQQAQALADLVFEFGWKYVSTVHSEGTYGSKGILQFQLAVLDMGICIAADEVIENNADDEALDYIIDKLITNKAAKVIVCFCDGSDVQQLIKALKRHGHQDDFTIIGSDGWNTRQDVVAGQEEAARGSLSVQLSSPVYQPFKEHYLSLDPENHTINPWFSEFWESKFNCSFSTDTQRQCTGHENFSQDFSVDGKIGFVVDAIYTAAYALHSMINNHCPNKRLCDRLLPLNGTMFYEYMLNTNFTTYCGKQLHFDSNGDPPGKYQVMNYQQFPNGSFGYVEIAAWEQGRLAIGENIQWKGENNTPPNSVCSEECPKGYATLPQSDASKCCWMCEKCSEGAIISPDSTCQECQIGWWPNENLTECVFIQIEHILWTDMEAVLPFICALVGMALALGTLYITAKNNDTAIVKASTRELSYLILAGIILAYVSTIAFIVKPSPVTCYVTRILPGLAFSMIYGSVLTKTNRIARILARGKKKIITKKPHCMTTSSLVLITVLMIVIESGIIIGILIWQPATTEIMYPTPGTARLECQITIYGILGPLGFDFLLIGLCTFYAVNTRNVPANFNEAKYIGFAMYTTCVIWIAFVPLYFGSRNKVITITLSITFSATVALMLLFWPKAYIIVWKPEQNHRGAFTTTTEVRCHVGQRSFAEKSISRRQYSYGLVKSKGGLNREISGLYQSEAPTTFDSLSPLSERLIDGFGVGHQHGFHKPEHTSGLFYDLTQRSVGCQVNFDKHVCMYSSPMWEISSEESCLSHGCGYFNVVDDASSMSNPPSYRSVCRHSSLRSRFHPHNHSSDTECIRKRCDSLISPSALFSKKRLVRMASDDPQLHSSRKFEYEKKCKDNPHSAKVKSANPILSPSRLKPISVRENIITTADVVLTADQANSPRSSVHFMAEDKGPAPQLPLIIEPNKDIVIQPCIRSVDTESIPKPALTGSADYDGACLTPDIKLCRKLYPNCDSPVHRGHSNGYIPISYTDNINSEKTTPHYLRKYDNPHSHPVSSICESSSPSYSGCMKYLDETASDCSSIEDQLAASPIREPLTTSSSTNGEEETTPSRNYTTLNNNDPQYNMNCQC